MVAGTLRRRFGEEKEVAALDGLDLLGNNGAARRGSQSGRAKGVADLTYGEFLWVVMIRRRSALNRTDGTKAPPAGYPAI